MTFTKLLSTLTLQQAQEWNATEEKWTWIDYNVMCDAGFPMRDDYVDSIEHRFCELLGQLKWSK